MLRHVQADLRDYVFIDMGAGKGLALLMASQYQFKKIIGVEYSETLAAIAHSNISAHKRHTQHRRDITCLCSDACDFKFPAQPAVVYFYNPFQGKVMDKVIRNIEQSLEHQPRDLWIVYYTPWEDRKFRRSSRFRIVESTVSFSVYQSVFLRDRNARSVEGGHGHQKEKRKQ
jgi:predicted RNA methylase